VVLATDIKSNNPHLAGGEKVGDMRRIDKMCIDLYRFVTIHNFGIETIDIVSRGFS
jgi:hypothetical protein